MWMLLLLLLLLLVQSFTSQGPLPIYKHGNTTGHHINVDSFSIVGREVHSITRTIKKAMFIRVNNTSLNRIQVNFSCPTTEMRYCMILLPSISGNALLLPLYNGSPLCHMAVGCSILHWYVPPPGVHQPP